MRLLHWAGQGRRLAGVLLCASLAACGGGTQLTAGDVVQVANATLNGVPSAAVKQLITYRMPGVRGSLVDATAIVLIPAGTPPSGGWPVIGWGHGTVGVADGCAPSASPTLASYDSYLNPLLAAGYAIVAPDYEGLGVAGGHPYLHLDSEGRSLLHAIKAATFQYQQLSTRYALLGHSQGGHAVVGGAELATAGEVAGISLVGVVAIAPASQVSAQWSVLNQIANNPVAPLQDRYDAAVGRIAFSGLVLAGIEAVDSNFDDASAYGPDGAFVPDLVAQQCTSGIFGGSLAPVQTVLGRDNSIEAILPASAVDIPVVASYLEDLEPGFRNISVPVLLLQGDMDTTVFPSSTQTLLNNMANLGIQATLQSFPGEGHTSVLAASAMTAIGFIAAQFASTP